MDWRFIRVLHSLFALVSALCIVLPLSFLLWGLHTIGRWTWRWLLQHAPEVDEASIQLSADSGAELHEEGNMMALSPTQEAPGAPPELAQPVQQSPEPQLFAAWWTDLEEASKKCGATFSAQQARALYELSTRTPAPGQEASESEVRE